MYTQTEGSGLGLSYSDVLELPFERIQWLLNRLAQQRKSEAEAISKASRSS